MSPFLTNKKKIDLRFNVFLKLKNMSQENSKYEFEYTYSDGEQVTNRNADDHDNIDATGYSIVDENPRLQDNEIRDNMNELLLPMISDEEIHFTTKRCKMKFYQYNQHKRCFTIKDLIHYITIGNHISISNVHNIEKFVSQYIEDAKCVSYNLKVNEHNVTGYKPYKMKCYDEDNYLRISLICINWILRNTDRIIN